MVVGAAVHLVIELPITLAVGLFTLAVQRRDRVLAAATLFVAAVLSVRAGSHLSFGSGAHVCIGAGLSLLEADVVLRAVLRRWPTLALADAAPRWNGIAGLRGLAALPVSVS